MRKKFIAGNWKMNMTETEAKNLTNLLKDKVNVKNVDVVFCVPSIDVDVVRDNIAGTNIGLGVQNFYFEDKGAYTGEISADMILDAGCKYVIIGHSERRQIFKEDNELINKKHIKAHAKGLIPILCCGETLETREKGETIAFVEGQIKSAFTNIDSEKAKDTIVAYEPIWAIGTGKTATADEAEAVCKAIRDVIGNIYGDDVKNTIRILYGGSMNSSNAKELLSKDNIDGGLIGGASLKEDFIKIVNYEGNN